MYRSGVQIPEIFPTEATFPRPGLIFKNSSCIWRIFEEYQMWKKILKRERKYCEKLMTFHFNTNSTLSVIYSLSKLISTTSVTTNPITTWEIFISCQKKLLKYWTHVKPPWMKFNENGRIWIEPKWLKHLFLYKKDDLHSFILLDRRME